MSFNAHSPRTPPISSILGALLLGYAQAISIAAPWSGEPLWWLQMLSLAGLVWLLDRSKTPLHAAALGWLFATSWLCGTVWWLYISMHVYGGLAAPLAAFAVFALCGFLALYYAAAAYFYKRFRALAGKNIAWSAIVFAAAWMLAELARDTWFTGFPWGAGGYAHVDGPFSVFIPWMGVYGLGFLIVFFNCWIYQLAVKPMEINPSFWQESLVVKLIIAVPFLIIISVSYFVPNYGTEKSAISQISLLQGNIPQGEKFEPSTGIKSALDWYQEQLVHNAAPIVITPETAIPLLPRQLPEGYWETIQKRFASGNQAALIGIPLGNFETGYSNSVLGLQPSAASGLEKPYQYDKHHLVPFGEFIPPLFKWFTQMMNIPLGDFNRGAVGQPSFEWAGQRWAPNICYEDLFGDELARRFVNEASAPTVMVNVSNIGWFGNTVAIDQHLHISRMRSLELGRPMVRATNTGATVIINHRGEVTHSLPRHTRGVLTGSVEGRTGITPFAWWAGRFGLWPLWILGIAIISIALYVGSKRARG